MHRLVRDGLIEMYWHSSRETQSVTGPISVPVDTPMTQAQIQDALVDDARWRPPDGTHGRPWVETPHVYFVATGEGEQAHREWRSVY